MNQPLDATFVRTFCERYRRAWNDRDADAVLALAAPDVAWEDPTIDGGHARGHAAVRAWLAGFWKTFPDMTFAPLDGPHDDALSGAYLGPDGPRLVVPWRCEGTMRGPLARQGIAPTGRRVALTGVDLYDFRGALLSRVRTVVDLQEAAQQLGLLPRPGTLAFRAMAATQRVLHALRRPHTR